MLKDLIKVANKLDALGLTVEADLLDDLIIKMAEDFASPISDSFLKEELNYIVPVKSKEWSWVMPHTWKYSKGFYDSESEHNQSLEAIGSGAGMAAFKIKKECEEFGASFDASCKRFLQLAEESLNEYLEYASDKPSYVEAGRRKWADHVVAFKRECESLISQDKIRQEGDRKREAKDLLEEVVPY
jgi:hypothetical protein